MDRLVFFLSALLLICITLKNSAFADSTNDERSMDTYSKRKSTALWFGPRLGRRKRNPNGEDTYRSPTLERDQLDALMEIIQESPWAIVAVNEGKRQNKVNFTPRLGRESGEDLVSGSTSLGGNRWLQDSELAGELMSQRSPPFAPRLGRRVLPFSPRLGRENDRS